MIGSSTFSPCVSSKPPKDAPERPRRLDILEQILKDDKHQLLSRNETAALKHFVTSFTWVDILSRASGLHPSPSPAAAPRAASHAQPFDYLPLLDDHTLDLSHVMGCESWVFAGIARTVLLESALSVRRAQLTCSRDDPHAADLYSQAAVLEVMLERGIRGLLAARAALTTELERQSSLVTELFALAAITYLHVAVSGAWPWLPPIRANVTRTMGALVTLPEELLIRVSWPFAVTGCMVLEEGRDVVREVVWKAGRKGVNTGTIWKGMVVVEECWRLRGGEVGAEVSWVNAMESLGEKILLC
jgi:C6 transcription factor Pro1